MDDLNRVLQNAVEQGIMAGVKNKFEGYNSPLQKYIDESIQAQANSFRGLLNEALSGAVSDAEFRQLIISETRKQLAKILVQRFGGELEKQINALKSDPTTRARITLAIEDIVKSKTD